MHQSHHLHDAQNHSSPVKSWLAVISVGLDNDYGHPAPSLLALLHDARMQVERTDQDGDVAVVVDGGLRVATR